MEFHDHIIWNHNEKSIQKSTHMLGTGSFIRKIAVEITELWESNTILLSKTNARVVNVKYRS